ncbi:hypothetical protein A2943_02480 [Candidatus Adlerbacteria bacterium RIFCSPLOWO2_01_FULL_51_16]|uniref:Carboxypeptidase regulatory-like domain-containing protein n=1 Tax=Candidatus Adlerbacteria bacterium RIFCSPLOWO2_01_FULL_51_16 TaxID=1797243 RepID=A0A1F4XGH1_9BACT|nr:MAG: hypothetical protein A2943_02480 [Candidatus Adlerbacteria bacterium RIFCSPLOWO2_01_FULL_51_16]
MKIILTIVSVVAAGLLLWFYVPQVRELAPTPGGGGGPVACTAEAMQCPDGSWVGRTGPNCEFVCPGGNSGGGGILPYNSGIRGTVMVGPTCPVERIPPDPNCADKPLQTLVAIYRPTDLVHAIVLMQSDAKGTFEVSLPPGEYAVGAGESTPPNCPFTEVVVGPDAYTSIVISCDSGIR